MSQASKSLSNLKNIFFPLLILISCISTAFFVYKDYGMHIDSINIRSIGGQAAIYANAKTGHLFLSKEQIQNYTERNLKSDSTVDKDKLESRYIESDLRYYGVFYEIFLLTGEYISGAKNIREAFFIRNLLIHFTFISALILLWFMLRQAKMSIGLSLFTCLLIYLSPRIFADSFYNSKDIPFLSFYLSAGISLFYFVNKSSAKIALFHGVLSGLVVSLRIPGIIIPAFTCFLVVFLSFFKIRKFEFKYISIYILVFLLTIFVAYPILWTNPIDNFIAAFQQMNAYPFKGDVLFLNSIQKSSKLSWFYFPIWFVSTTPIIVLLGLLLFPFALFQKLRNNKWNNEGILIMLALGLGGGPIAAILLLSSDLYDAWRQVFFVYPFFVILSIYGLSHVSDFFTNKHILSKALASFIGSLFLLHLLLINYQLHPYQNVYFNCLAIEPITKNYELDYWGLSFRESFEYILEHSNAEKISVCVNRTAGQEAWTGLTNRQKKRLLIEDDINKAQYFVYAFRATLDEKEDIKTVGFTYGNQVFQVERNGLVLSRVFKLNSKK